MDRFNTTVISIAAGLVGIALIAFFAVVAVTSSNNGAAKFEACVAAGGEVLSDSGYGPLCVLR